MKEIITWTVISGLIFIGFLTILIFGLVKNKRKFVLLSIGLLSLLVVSSGWTIYLFGGKSYNRVADMLKPRTGEEIYTALFGKAEDPSTR